MLFLPVDVGNVNEWVVEVVELKGLGGEPGGAFFVEENKQGREAGDEPDSRSGDPCWSLTFRLECD